MRPDTTLRQPPASRATHAISARTMTAPRVRYHIAPLHRPGLGQLAAGHSFAQSPVHITTMRRSDPATLQTLQGRSMGTSWSVRLHNPALLPLEDTHAAIAAALDEVVQQMSHWEANSVLSRFSRAPAGSTHPLPTPMRTVLSAALHWARESDGAFDPTAAPLVAAWGFGPAAAHRRAEQPWQPPSPGTLTQARQQVGWQRLLPALHDATHVTQPGGVELDFSGIAKGFAVDHIIARLHGMGWSDFLVEVGGELRASGKRPDGQAWHVAIAPLPGEDTAAPPRRLPLRDMAVATSGDLWHCHTWQGRRYSHTIDPRTGEPVSHGLASVTVLHRECMHADAIATVLTVLGMESGLAFAEARHIPALLCERLPAAAPEAIRIRTTTAFAALTSPCS